MISKKDIVNNKMQRDGKLIKYLENLFDSLHIPGENIAIDECMMAFKGKMKNKVFNPMKSDKWGMKFYVCADSETGYVHNLRICGEYCSIETKVTELTEKLTGENRKLFMDNYYNSFKKTSRF